MLALTSQHFSFVFTLPCSTQTVAAFAALQRDDPLFAALLLIGEHDGAVLVLLERKHLAALEIRIAVEQIIGVVLLEIDELVEILFVRLIQRHAHIFLQEVIHLRSLRLDRIMLKRHRADRCLFRLSDLFLYSRWAIVEELIEVNIRGSIVIAAEHHVGHAHAAAHVEKFRVEPVNVHRRRFIIRLRHVVHRLCAAGGQCAAHRKKQQKNFYSLHFSHPPQKWSYYDRFCGTAALFTPSDSPPVYFSQYGYGNAENTAWPSIRIKGYSKISSPFGTWLCDASFHSP